VLVAGALTAISHLNANAAYVRKSKTGLNLYQCLVAGTGQGKEGPRKGIKKLLQPIEWAEASNGIHENMASGPALLRSLENDPQSSALIMLDEFGKYLQTALADRGLVHDKDFMKELMIMFGLSRSYYAGRSYADTKRNIQPIEKPYVSVLGTTTPETFMDGLSSTQIQDGFLNRILIIEASERNPVTGSLMIRYRLTYRSKSKIYALWGHMRLNMNLGHMSVWLN
jgi:hypothetical protein